jgi:plastocyanin
MRKERVGIATSAIVAVVVVIVVVAAIGGYLAVSGPKSSSSTTSSSTQSPSSTTTTPITSTSSTSSSASASSSSSAASSSTTSSASTSNSSTSTATGSADLIVTASPASIDTGPGLTINYTSISITPLSVTGVTSANLKIVGLSPGVTASLASNSVDVTSGPQSVGLTLTVAANVTPGAYQFSVNYVAGSKNVTSQFAFTVVAHIVFINNEQYLPANVTVPTGATVTWMNLQGIISETDPGDHNVVSIAGASSSFTSSPTLAQYSIYSYTFTAAGAYKYYCTFHPTVMFGEVVVSG